MQPGFTCGVVASGVDELIEDVSVVTAEPRDFLR
jgi:hypothetical protein